MTRHPKRWLVVAVLFTLINLGGGVYAAVLGEGLHAAVHFVLLLVGAAWISRLARGPGEQDLSSIEPSEQRLEQLQHSVDAVALEVERIGEAQRFIVKLATERAKTRAESAT